MPMPMSKVRPSTVLVRPAVAATPTATKMVTKTESQNILKPSSKTASESALFERTSRRELLNDAKPFSDFLTDTFHRQHDYLRISLTERCNLRCVYCMPEEGVPLSPQRELLTTPEIIMLSSLFVSQGVTKIRLTGGEPTVRRDILPLMRQIGALRSRGLRELCLTTNGLALHRKLEDMVDAGLTGINLSLDTLDPWQFQIMTRRKGFDAVMKSIERVLELNTHGAGIKLKINSVVMRGTNDREIMKFVEMTREKGIEVRFIEYMPFDGNKWNKGKMFSYSEMLHLIKEKYPQLERVKGHKNETSKTFKIPGFAGSLGFITSMTHNFCGTCNRLRITSDGNLKVCLFGNAEVSLRDILRKCNNGEPIDESTFEVMKQVGMHTKPGLTNGSVQSGLAPNEQELLDVIGLAVKRKKAKHAGIGELEHMKNRPMILIESGAAHMVSISDKTPSKRVAKAICSVQFTDMIACRLIQENQIQKGDVLGVARVAGIMAAKKTSDLIPLCHPIALSKVTVNLQIIQDQDDTGRVDIEAIVACEGKTGVEMEALTAASTAALTIYDMCKAVDKRMTIEGLKVVLKEGGKSGRWVDGVQDSSPTLQ
ncbi:hypothetical protein EKO27_g1233 [Xylaria grammica]|uniref:Radical SAM core domain-containing protein n=1 Tax=Xylaria grammica TaxID=363999 RepID=A0A439DHG5_9PEZI|nr:hypothetical protein EKO27_g1233 [Xylaria grammica]